MFTRHSIPTPFQVGAVNAYLTDRTLVDPGPDSEEAWTHLLDALDEHDLAPTDVERVLVTHPHPDHFGLAHRFADAGASVVASDPAAEVMRDFPANFERERSFFTDFFERCGMARETAETVTGLPEVFLRYAPSVETDRVVETGDDLTVAGESVSVEVTSGHAPGEAIFAFEGEQGRQAIVGDHVLADITPNPFLQPPAEPGGERPHVLPTYNRSLERLAEEGFDRLLAGHREAIEAPTDRIEAMLESHERRTSNVLDHVSGPTTPVEVMEGLFGDLPVTEQFPGMSEAVGHLDVLQVRGEVESRDEGGVRVYERT